MIELLLLSFFTIFITLAVLLFFFVIRYILTGHDMPAAMKTAVGMVLFSSPLVAFSIFALPLIV